MSLIRPYTDYIAPPYLKDPLSKPTSSLKMSLNNKNSAVNAPDFLGEELGRGGFGTVFAKKDDPRVCIKVSNKSTGAPLAAASCRQWSNEFKKMQTFMARVEQHPAFAKLQMVRVVKPIDFVETPRLCYMTMPRIYRPEGRHSSGLTLQAQMGEPSCRLVHKGRGEFIGLKEIRQYVSPSDLKVAARELGTAMALIHFVGRNDAYDLEVFLGKEANTKKCRFYLADFDLSEEVPAGKLNPQVVERLTWSLDAIPYFPRPDTDQELFDLFLDGYKSVAGNEAAVQSIFADYGNL